MGSRPGDLILDPYSGTGVTGRAAKMLSRNAELIEINEELEETIKAMVK